MPVTYNLIASNTLSSPAASVTFSAIPGTYTDLLIRFSARQDFAAGEIDVRFNNDSGANYSSTRIVGNGATATSARITSSTLLRLYEASAYSSFTSNTFGSTELYIPNYTASSAKPLSSTAVAETNATTAYVVGQANLWNNTAAITSIRLAVNALNFDTGSSFYLYGIKNS